MKASTTTDSSAFGGGTSGSSPPKKKKTAVPDPSIIITNTSDGPQQQFQCKVCGRYAIIVIFVVFIILIFTGSVHENSFPPKGVYKVLKLNYLKAFLMV